LVGNNFPELIVGAILIATGHSIIGNLFLTDSLVVFIKWKSIRISQDDRHGWLHFQVPQG
jgi:hypothetical protein